MQFIAKLPGLVLRLLSSIGLAAPLALFLFVSGAALPFLIRILYLIEEDFRFIHRDWWGFAGDWGAGLAVMLLITSLAWYSRVAAALAGIIWVLANFGYYEFLSVLHSPYFALHAGEIFDPTFLQGSGMSPTHPLLLLAALAALIAHAFAVRRNPRPRWAGPLLLAGAFLVAVLPLAAPYHSEVPSWRQRNFLPLNASDLYSRAIVARTQTGVSSKDRDAFLALTRGDLSGSPLVELGNRGTNVLVVILEGVSGGYLPHLAAAHDNKPRNIMAGLDKIARDGLSFSTHVTHQKKTNRGEYAILCGDYPGLASSIAQMTQVAHGKAKKCLPAVLRDAGYETVYIQSANLNYMFKDMFMPVAGFSRVHGTEWFNPRYARQKWGVDDFALFEQSLDEMERLGAQGKPWFMTLMSSGTHHPYNIPADFRPEMPQQGREGLYRALLYLDEQVAWLYVELARRGILNNTLVLFTSDEASEALETVDSKDTNRNGMTENWGFAVALTPQKIRARVDSVSLQSDIALSVLDYLGAGELSPGFVGRSMFRRYPENRTAHYANIYKRQVYEYSEAEKRLDVCEEDLSVCARYHTSKNRLFGHDFGDPQLDGRATGLLRAAQAVSLETGSTALAAVGD